MLHSVLTCCWPDVVFYLLGSRRFDSFSRSRDSSVWLEQQAPTLRVRIPPIPFGRVAQLVEQWTVNPCLTKLNPSKKVYHESCSWRVRLDHVITFGTNGYEPVICKPAGVRIPNSKSVCFSALRSGVLSRGLLLKNDGAVKKTKQMPLLSIALPFAGGDASRMAFFKMTFIN